MIGIIFIIVIGLCIIDDVFNNLMERWMVRRFHQVGTEERNLSVTGIYDTSGDETQESSRIRRNRSNTAGFVRSN